MAEKCENHDRIERVQDDQQKQINENATEISNIHKDITDVLPLQIDKAVGSHFTNYKAEKAVYHKEKAEKEKEERAVKNKWYKNQFLLIGAIIALVQAATEFIKAKT